MRRRRLVLLLRRNSFHTTRLATTYQAPQVEYAAIEYAGLRSAIDT